MMKKIGYILLPVATSLILASCGGDDNKSDEIENNATDTNATKVTTNNAVSETFFQVPSPGEMLTFIKMIGGKKTPAATSFLNSPENQKNYTDNKLKAINFGIYSCDLSYCSIFEIGSEALKYFKCVKQMGDQIGVSTAIKPEIMKRLENNIGNSDSLSVITDDVYFSSFETLEDGKQGSTLALVVAGGWIESLFIATNLATYKQDSPVIERLADQKYTLENLIEFLKKHEGDQNVASVKSDFEGLLAEFGKIEQKDVAASDTKGADKGKKMLNGGKQLVMTEATYKAIVAKVKAVRDAYALTK
jgi:hypothetical protein